MAKVIWSGQNPPATCIICGEFGVRAYDLGRRYVCRKCMDAIEERKRKSKAETFCQASTETSDLPVGLR